MMPSCKDLMRNALIHWHTFMSMHYQPTTSETHVQINHHTAWLATSTLPHTNSKQYFQYQQHPNLKRTWWSPMVSPLPCQCVLLLVCSGSLFWRTHHHLTTTSQTPMRNFKFCIHKYHNFWLPFSVHNRTKDLLPLRLNFITKQFACTKSANHAPPLWKTHQNSMSSSSRVDCMFLRKRSCLYSVLRKRHQHILFIAQLFERKQSQIDQYWYSSTKEENGIISSINVLLLPSSQTLTSSCIRNSTFD